MFLALTVMAASPYVPIYQAMPPRAVLARPVPELEYIAWMAGAWRCHTHSFAVGSTPSHDFGESTYTAKMVMRNALNRQRTWLQLADSASRDLSFITYDPMTKHWVVTGIEWPVSYGTSVGTIVGNKIVVIGDATVFGRQYRLRQTYTKLSNDAFKIFNEEQLPDGTWMPDDEYDFVRLKSKPHRF